MKKLIAICLFVFMFTANIKAAENTLYFSREDSGLVYDTEQLDKSLFMNHKDMIPGKKHKDVLKIYNASENTCNLYFQVVERDQNELADEILKNINMKIYLDEELMYDGTALGQDVKELGVDLQNTVFIGKYEPDKEQTLTVHTELDKSYTNYNNKEESYIDWKFYGECVSGEIEVINPNTGDTYILKAICILLVVLIISIMLFKYATNKQKRFKKSYR